MKKIRSNHCEHIGDTKLQGTSTFGVSKGHTPELLESPRSGAEGDDDRKDLEVNREKIFQMQEDSLQGFHCIHRLNADTLTKVS